MMKKYTNIEIEIITLATDMISCSGEKKQGEDADGMFKADIF
jgi:hypothetical protein